MVKKRILVVAVHPDDETLGCGGTLLKLKARGHDIFWLIVTRMDAQDGFSAIQIAARQKEIARVKKLFGFKDVLCGDLKSTHLDEYPSREVVQRIAQAMGTVKPNMIFVPFKHDIHSDHRVTFEAVMSAAKRFRYPSIEKVMMFETISETEQAPALKDRVFVPNAFCDISKFIDKKIKIMKIYKSEMGKHPFPRSEKNIRALATFRGATVNAQSAEAFMVLKDIF